MNTYLEEFKLEVKDVLLGHSESDIDISLIEEGLGLLTQPNDWQKHVRCIREFDKRISIGENKTVSKSLRVLEAGLRNINYHRDLGRAGSVLEDIFDGLKVSSYSSEAWSNAMDRYAPNSQSFSVCTADLLPLLTPELENLQFTGWNASAACSLMAGYIYQHRFDIPTAVENRQSLLLQIRELSTPSESG